jgi:hypothetical protein
MENFVQEAITLLEPDDIGNSIAHLQGLMCLYAVMAIREGDEDGLKYFKSAIDIYQQLLAEYILIESVEFDSLSAEDQLFSHVLNIICWSVFNFATMYALAYQKPPRMLVPVRLPPPNIDDVFAWTPCPHTSTAFPAHVSRILRYRSSLCSIQQDIIAALFDRRTRPQGQTQLGNTFITLAKKLETWESELRHQLRHNE